MAKDKETRLNILTPAERKVLEDLGSDIERSQKTIDLLKELGLGTTDLQSKLDWAKKRRDILLAKG